MDSLYDTPMPMLPRYRVTTTVSIMAEKQDYNHRLMNIPAVWRNTRGGGVPVVVLDTGLPQHVDLNPAGSKSFIPRYNADLNGHSTHVGGILAATAGNDMGIAGIAPECEHHYGAVLGKDGNGTVQAIIQGIRWAVDEVGAKVINMSLGIPAGVRHLKALEDACNYAVDQGATVIAAAGNESGRVGQPAIFDSVLAVAAVDQSMEHAWFSNIGPEVDLAAGGVQVYSTWLKNGYSKLNGTSMAAPAIAGAATLIIADRHQSSGDWLSPTEVADKLKKIAFDVGPEGFDEQFGHGIPVFQHEDPEKRPDEDVEEPPEAPAEDDPCDCTLAGPLARRFLKAASRAARNGSNGLDAMAVGFKAAGKLLDRAERAGEAKKVNPDLP